ncbi:spondin domain-containing protein [Candidatus Palauibacter sp.]|uniref:spondin domain-containing protein n=1 Tax=Candidatus Palauibacter sp. TaxID=3101350 RepID=UPI003B52199D
MATTATYRVVFDATWSASTHPTNFPGGAHFSPLIGAVHNDSVTFWALEGIATPGIESMAETGGTAALAAEVQAEIPGGALGVINGSGSGSPGSATIQAVTVREDFPLVTLVTMIAPSPDWFAGVTGLSLRDEDGGWVEELEVVLYPLDAGTDSGSAYTSANDDTRPKEPIRGLQGERPFSDEPIGTFTFTRTDG